MTLILLNKGGNKKQKHEVFLFFISSRREVDVCNLQFAETFFILRPDRDVRRNLGENRLADARHLLDVRDAGEGAVRSTVGYDTPGQRRADARQGGEQRRVGGVDID